MDATDEALALVGTKLDQGSLTIAKALNELGIRNGIGERTFVEVPSLGITAQTDAQDIVRVVHMYSEGVSGPLSHQARVDIQADLSGEASRIRRASSAQEAGQRNRSFHEIH